MKEKFLISFFSIIITIGCLVGMNFVWAWAEPTLAPPAGNVPAPINVSADLQTKTGGFGLGGADAEAGTGLTVAGEQKAVLAVSPSTGAAVSRAVLAAKNAAADFYYAGNTSAVTINSKREGLTVNSTDYYGIVSKGKAGGLFASDANSTNWGAIGMLSGYGMLVQGQQYGASIAGLGASSTGIYAEGKKIGIESKGAGATGLGILAEGKGIGLKAENLVSNYSVEAATQDYALKAVKDGNTYVTLAGKDGVGVTSYGGIYAGKFFGDVDVQGSLNVSGICKGDLCFGDLAEKIDTAMNVEIGDIVQINEQGFAEKANQAYSKKAIGVISNPAIVFPGAQINPDLKNVKRQPLALTGLVFVKVSNINGPIEIGDYITSSSIPGYGMKATASGPVIGKALQAFDKNRGSMIILLDLDWVSSDR